MQILIMIISILILVACEAKSVDADKSGKSAAQDINSRSEPLNNFRPKEKAAHISQYQKPGASIRLISPDFIRIDRDTSEEFIFSFSSTATTGVLNIRVQFSSGLMIDDVQNNYRFEMPNTAIRIPVSVQALANGEQSIYFIAELNGRARTLGTRVWVGDLASYELEKSQKTQARQAPAGVISMPAQESVRVHTTTVTE